MKKYLFAMLGALFVFTACTTGKPENDGNKTTEEENDYITMYVASEVSSRKFPFLLRILSNSLRMVNGNCWERRFYNLPSNKDTNVRYMSRKK